MKMALDQQYLTNDEFQDVNDHAGRTRAAIRGFIKYLVAYKQDQQNKDNPERWTLNLWTFELWTNNPEPWTLKDLWIFTCWTYY